MVTKPPSEYRKEISPNVINTGQLAAIPASLMAASSLSLGAPELALGMLPYELQAEAFLNQGDNIRRAAQTQETLYDARRGINRAAGAGHNLYYSPDIERPISEAVGGINRIANAKTPLPQRGSNAPYRPVQGNQMGKSLQSMEPRHTAKAGVLQAIRNAMQDRGLL